METILIIGAGSAIAQAVAREYAARGARLILWGRSPEKMKIISDDLLVRHAAAVHVDCFDFNDFARHKPALDAALVFAQGALDGALICHGTLSDQAQCERDFDASEMELRTNLLSPISFLTLLANYFESRGSGWLGAISSVAGDRGRKSNYVYGTAKAGLNAFLQGLRARLWARGVHVITIEPGFVATPMTAHLRKNFLFATPEKVAGDIVRAIDRREPILYTPWFWRWIMLIIRSIPEKVFRRLPL